MSRFFNWIKGLFSKNIAPSEHVTPIPIPPVGGDPGFYVGVISGATQAEAMMILDAVKLCQAVVRSQAFADEVLKAKFTSTDGISNESILSLYTSRAITVNVHMFTGSFMQNRVYHTVGYDNAGDDFVHANRYFVQDAETLGSLIMHECAHSFGFHHSKASEKTSVPYSMNTIFEKISETLKGKKQ